MGRRDPWTSTKRRRRKKKRTMSDSESEGSHKVTNSTALMPARVSGELIPDHLPTRAIKKEPDDGEQSIANIDKESTANIDEESTANIDEESTANIDEESTAEVGERQLYLRVNAIKKEPEDVVNNYHENVSKFLMDFLQQNEGGKDDDDRESVETVPESRIHSIEEIILDDELPNAEACVPHSCDEASPQSPPLPCVKIKQEPLSPEPKNNNKRTAETAMNETALSEKIELLKKRIKSEPAPDSPPSRPFGLIPISEVKRREQETSLAPCVATSLLPEPSSPSKSESHDLSIPVPVDESKTETFSIDVMKWFNVCAVYDESEIEESIEYISKFAQLDISGNASTALFYDDSAAETSLVDQQIPKISEDSVRKPPSDLNSEKFGFGVPTIQRPITKLTTDQVPKIIDTATALYGSQPPVTFAHSDTATKTLVNSKVTQLESKVLGKAVARPSYSVQPSNESSESRSPKLQPPRNFGFGVSESTAATELLPQTSEVSSIAPPDVQIHSVPYPISCGFLTDWSCKDIKNLLSFTQSGGATGINSSGNAAHNSRFEPSEISNLQHDTSIPCVEPQICSSAGKRIPVVNRFLVSEDLPSSAPQTILGKRRSSGNDESEKKSKISSAEYVQRRLTKKDPRRAPVSSTAMRDQPSSSSDDSSLLIESIFGSETSVDRIFQPESEVNPDSIHAFIEELKQSSSSNSYITANSPVHNNASVSSVNRDPQTTAQIPNSFHPQSLPVIPARSPMYEQFQSLPGVSSKINGINFPTRNVSISSVNRDSQTTAQNPNSFHPQSLPVIPARRAVYEHFHSLPDVSSKINGANFPTRNVSISSLSRDPRRSSVRNGGPTFSARISRGPNCDLYKNVGQDKIDDFLGLLLHWNVDWLQTQKEVVDVCPPLCGSYPKCDVFYRDEREYYNTYLPLHLLNIWFRLFEAWSNGGGLLFEWKYRAQESNNHYQITEFNADVKSTDPLPKRDDIAICKKLDGSEVFLLVETVLEKTSLDGSSKRLKIECRSVSELAATLGDTVSVHVLMNVRIANLANSALKNPHSFMKKILVNPREHSKHIEHVQLQPKKAAKEMRDDIIRAIKQDHIRVCLAEVTDELSRRIGERHVKEITHIITLVAFSLSQETDRKILVILKDDDEYFKALVRRLKIYHPVLAVRNKEISLDEDMKCLTMEHRRSEEGSSQEDIVSTCRFFITTFSSYQAERLLTKFKSVCIVHPADMCTEADTILPLAMNTKLILFGERKMCPGLCELLNRRGYNTSLFMRLLEAKYRS